MDFEAIEMGLRQSPLMLAMYETMDEDPARFETEAKRQHFVPQLLLRKFASEAEGKHWVYQLDVRKGTPRRVDVAAAASSRYFYAWTAEDGTRNNRIEGFLAWVEGYAAPALVRFLDDPERLSDGDRGTLSYFLALQYQRTPEAAKATASVSDTAMRMMFASEFSNPTAFAAQYRKIFADEGHQASEDEIEAFRTSLLDDLRTGAVSLADPQAHALHSGMQLAGSALYFIYGMSWELLLGEHFVTSDRGMSLCDPSPSFPWSSEGLLSSDGAQTIAPLSDTACLVLRPSGDPLRVSSVEEARVDEINLRMYGWAGAHIFGRTQDDVARVRKLAKARPSTVPRPRPKQHPFLFEADPKDRTLAQRNIKRGWPPYLWSAGLPHDYLVLERGENPVDAALLISGKVAERARRALGLQPGDVLNGNEMTEVIGPDEIQGGSATTQVLGEWREFVKKMNVGNGD